MHRLRLERPTASAARRAAAIVTNLLPSAEEAVKRVAGVRTVAQDLTVKLLGHDARSDFDLSAAIESALGWDILVPKQVTAKVLNAVVTLAGQVTWNFQRESAERVVRHLKGVVAVNNDITLRPHVSTSEVKKQIQAALQRQASADAKSIRIHTVGGTVTLTGHASSWQSIEDAAHAAWAAPGVTVVLDQITRQMTL